MPSTTDYRQSHQCPSHAKAYARSFENEHSYRGIVWELERNLLKRIVDKYLQNQPIQHLDFACGSGRILAHMSRSAEHSVGVDVSPAMLKYARQAAPHAEIRDIDLTSSNSFTGREFNLITAFRFFPNAEPDLRRDVMHILAGLLSKNGYLVFNNHRNLNSAYYRLTRLLGRGGRDGMSTFAARDLIADAGLEIVGAYHLCVLPVSERHPILPPTLLSRVEGVLAKLAILRPLAQEQVFVCRRR